MKKTKRKNQFVTDSLSVELELSESKRKKKNAIIWLAVYTVLIIVCCVLWERSKLTIYSLLDCFAVLGCAMVAIVIIGIAVSLFLYLFDKQMRALEYYTSTDWLIVNIVSFIGTGFAICLPIGVILILIESIEPVYSWLATPIFSVLKFRGIRILGWIFAAIPYLLLWIKLSKNSKRISWYTKLLQDLQEQQALQMYAKEGNNEPFDPAQSKSWQKMKAQRRAAEQRKMNHSQTNFEETDDQL